MPRKAPWSAAGIEPLISELLSDEAGQALMKADGVTAKDVMKIIGEQRLSRIGLTAMPLSKAERCAMYDRRDSSGEPVLPHDFDGESG